MPMSLTLRGLGVIALLMMGGCASKVPLQIQQSLPDSPTVGLVLADAEAYAGQEVRWGGVIVSVENKPGETWMEVSSRPLDGTGRPRKDDESAGRFIARLGGFFDPSIYRPDRRLTVYGTVEGSVEGAIGEMPYRFPVVRVLDYELWEEREALPLPYDPWWRPMPYDPFFPYYWPRSYLYWGP